MCVPHSSWTGERLRLTPPEDGSAVYLILDFGREVLASPELALQGPPGTAVDLGYSEMLEDDRVAPMRESVAHNDRMILGEGLTVHRFLQPRGFRFMMLRIADFDAPVILESVCAYECIYPTASEGSFRSSDPLLSRIHELCARTVNLCMEDAYTDCPWRERSQWLGDMQPEALFSYYCFASFEMARKAIIEFAESQTPDGWIPGVVPSPHPFNVPTWGMRFPVIAWEYYLYTGDRETLVSSYEAVTRQMTWLAGYENEHGLLENLSETSFVNGKQRADSVTQDWYIDAHWLFVDWTPCDRKDGDGVIQGWYLDALNHAALIAGELGDTEASVSYKRKAKLLRETALPRFYWSERHSAFLKYGLSFPKRAANVPADVIGQHENFLFTLLKVGARRMRRRALNAVKGATGMYLPNIGLLLLARRTEGKCLQ